MKIFKALLIAPLCGVFFCAPAYAQKTKAQLSTEITTTFPDNTVGAITPAGVRAYETDVITSIMPTAPVASGNLACFSGTTGLLQDCAFAPGFFAPIASPTFTGTVTIPGGSALGTPTSITLSNATGLPLGTGVTGTLQAAQEPAHTGDCTNSAGSLALTCLKTNGVSLTATATAAAGQLPGEPSTGSASAGNVGEYVESVIVSGSATALTTGTAKTVTSISLTAGDWDVDCVALFSLGATTNYTDYRASLSTTTNTLDATTGRTVDTQVPASAPGAVGGLAQTIPPYRFSLSGTTSIFLVEQANFTVSTMSGYGIIRARRVR